MKNKIAHLLANSKQLFFRYPFVLLMSFALVATIIFGIETEPEKEIGVILLKLGLCFSLGISLQFALKMLSQRVTNGLVWQLCGFLFLLFYYFIFPTNEEDLSEKYYYIIGSACILSHLLVAFVPFIKKQNSELHFWQYNKNLFINLFLTAVFTGVLIAGVVLAIVAVKELFDLSFNDKLYFEVFVCLSIFGSTIIFLLFNESGLDYLEKEGKYPVVLKFFTQFILIPLLIIYVVILYIYTAKIILNWQLPRGWVSYLVLAYSIVGIFALLLVHPLKDLKAKSWIFIFNKAFYYTLIPLLVLLFVAIFTRVLQYGFTEPRYYVLLISIWLTIIVGFFIFYKNATIKFIPISLFIFGLFALIFPYLNAFSTAIRSQENTLIEVLTKNNVLTNNKIDFNKTVSDSVATNITDKLSFLHQKKDFDFLEKVLDKKTFDKVKSEKYCYFNNLFNNIKYESVPAQPNNYVNIYTNQKFIKLEDYQYILDKDQYNYSIDIETKINGDKILVENKDNKQIFIKINGKSVDIMPQVKAICDKYKNKSDSILVDDISFVIILEKYQIKVIFGSIDWYKGDKTYNCRNVKFLLKTK